MDDAATQGRDRRSDRRRSSRRHQKKREREQLKKAERARKEKREARLAAAAAEAAAHDLELDVEAEPSSALDVSDSADLSRTERRVLARRRRRSGSLSKAGHGVMVLALVAAAAGVGGGLRLLTRDDDSVGPDGVAGVGLADGVDPQPALLLVTGDAADGTAPADSAILLAYDRLEETATVLFIPVSTVADVPGHGVLPIARALDFGGAALVAATTDNLLGITVDGVAALDYRSWATLLGRVGGLEVEVPERLVTTDESGATQVQFLAGVQNLDGLRAAEYLRARVDGQPELQALPRAQALLVAWLEALAADANLLDEVVADGLPMIDTGMARSEVVALVRSLVDAVAADRLEFRVLPVRPIGSGAEDGYRPDEARLIELVGDRLAPSVPSVDREGRSLQVLNGNGLPGIGQDVAARLLPAGFRVVLTGNADTFDHARTKIVVYDDSPEQLAIAAEIRDLLGVGDVEISLAPQSVVDVTIVVGRDFTAS